MDTARSKTSLKNFETAAFAGDEVRLVHPDVLKEHLRVAVRSIVVAEHGQVPDELDTSERLLDEQDGLPGVRVGVVGVGLADKDHDLAARVGEARGPPLATVDNVIVGVLRVLDDR